MIQIETSTSGHRLSTLARLRILARPELPRCQSYELKTALLREHASHGPCLCHSDVFRFVQPPGLPTRHSAGDCCTDRYRGFRPRKLATKVRGPMELVCRIPLAYCRSWAAAWVALLLQPVVARR